MALSSSEAQRRTPPKPARIIGWNGGAIALIPLRSEITAC